MSLQEGVIGIAQMLEEHAEQWLRDETDISPVHLRMFAQHLRILVKSHPEQPVAPPAAVMPAELQHAVMIEKARAEFRKGKQEEKEPCVAQLLGGASNGDCIPIDSQMPVGAKTRVGNEVYQLQVDHKLHFLASAK